MAWSVTAEPEKFDEAIAWFKDRFPITDDLAEALGEYAGERAWTISGVSQLDIVLDVYERLLKSIEDGTPYNDFKKDVEEKLTEAWGSPNGSRIETIWRNATQQSLNAGRWRQMSDPEVKKLRPFVLVDGIGDQRQSDICKEIDGTVVSIDSPWLAEHQPQLHHRCRTQLRNISQKDAERRGITDELPEVDADPGFGKPPTASMWKPKASDYPKPLFAEYEKKFDDLKKNAPRKKVTPSED